MELRELKVSEFQYVIVVRNSPCEESLAFHGLLFLVVVIILDLLCCFKDIQSISGTTAGFLFPSGPSSHLGFLESPMRIGLRIVASGAGIFESFSHESGTFDSDWFALRTTDLGVGLELPNAAP